MVSLMGLFRNLFKKSTSFPNLLNECRPHMKQAEDEQERTFVGMLKVFCDDYGLQVEPVSNELLFKARLLGGVMYPSYYGSRGFEQSGFFALMNLVWQLGMFSRNGTQLLPENQAVALAESFVQQAVHNIANDYARGVEATRYSNILSSLLNEAAVSLYGVRFESERYEHFIQGNVRMGLSRAAFAFGAS